MAADPYWRRCRLLRVVDGDTVWLVIDLGWRRYSDENVRILGVDTPEMVGADRAAGLAARNFVAEWFAEHAKHAPRRLLVLPATWPFLIRSEKADSFGRFLGHIECAQGHDLTTALIAAGHGRPA